MFSGFEGTESLKLVACILSAHLARLERGVESVIHLGKQWGQ
jgi:hypothetical protein